MNKVLLGIIMIASVLALTGCGGKKPAANEAGGGSVAEPAKQSEVIGESSTRQITPPANSKTLPDSYPKDILPLAADAEILDVRENPSNKGLEVSYVSSNNIDTLCDFYEGALKDAGNLSTMETQDGYMITAKLNDVGYSIMLSKDAMKSNPLHSEKISVYIILTGVAGVSGVSGK
ncbi:hypothetical protein ACH6CV_03005 [Bacillota bacterium Meth-B3]|nr:hypothetical protein [Christensenellaceae bacterium]